MIFRATKKFLGRSIHQNEKDYLSMSKTIRHYFCYGKKWGWRYGHVREDAGWRRIWWAVRWGNCLRAVVGGRVRGDASSHVTWLEQCSWDLFLFLKPINKQINNSFHARENEMRTFAHVPVFWLWLFPFDLCRCCKHDAMISFDLRIGKINEIASYVTHETEAVFIYFVKGRKKRKKT